MSRALPIGPIRKRNLAEEIADRIRSRIVDGTLRPGEKLPPERELARQFKVNRSSLREGLKILQQLGLVAVRHGDGTTVLDVFQSAGIELVRHLLADRSVDRRKLLADVCEVRALVCVPIVRLAARNARPDAVAQLRRALEEAAAGDEEGGDPLVRDFEFYERLARLSGNLVLVLLLNTVKPAFRLFKPAFGGLVVPPARLRETHASILEAIARGDEEGAAAVADEHLAQSARSLLATAGEESTEP